MAANDTLIFRTSVELVRLPISSVTFITAEGNYSTINMADGNKYILTLQLGQIEQRISQMIDPKDFRFIRVGKSLIVNARYITLINPSRQKLVISDCRSFRSEVSASREALKALKDIIVTQYE